MKLAAETLKLSIKRTLLQSENLIFDSGFLYSVDQELTVKTSGPELGSFSVASKTLSQIVGRLTGEVSIEFLDPTLVIKSGRSRFKLNTAKAEAPKMPDVGTGFSTSLPELKNALRFCVQATESSMKYSYQGSVLLSGKRTVATDGFRLAMFGMSSEFSKILIPARAAQTLLHLEGDQIVIGESDSALMFRTSEVTLTSQKLAKNFCSYESHVPQNMPFNCSFKAEEMKASLQRVAPMAKQVETEVTKVRVKFSEGTCTLTTASDIGQADDELAYEGDVLDLPTEVVLNHGHVMDYVSGVTGLVKFGCSDRQASFENSNKQLICMALRK